MPWAGLRASRTATGWGSAGLGFPWRPLHTVSLDLMGRGAQEVGASPQGPQPPAGRLGTPSCLLGRTGLCAASIHHALCEGFQRARESPVWSQGSAEHDPSRHPPAAVRMSARHHQATGRVGRAWTQAVALRPEGGPERLPVLNEDRGSRTSLVFPSALASSKARCWRFSLNPGAVPTARAPSLLRDCLLGSSGALGVGGPQAGAGWHCGPWWVPREVHRAVCAGGGGLRGGPTANRLVASV